MLYRRFGRRFVCVCVRARHNYLCIALHFSLCLQVCLCACMFESVCVCMTSSCGCPTQGNKSDLSLSLSLSLSPTYLQATVRGFVSGGNNWACPHHLPSISLSAASSILLMHTFRRSYSKVECMRVRRENQVTPSDPRCGVTVSNTLSLWHCRKGRVVANPISARGKAWRVLQNYISGPSSWEVAVED
jgi:hypothetical protein